MGKQRGEPHRIPRIVSAANTCRHRSQGAQPVETAPHVGRVRRMPDAGPRPTAENNDRLTRRTTPSPRLSSTSQPGTADGASSTEQDLNHNTIPPHWTCHGGYRWRS